METNDKPYFQDVNGKPAYLWPIKPANRVMARQVEEMGVDTAFIIEDVFSLEYGDYQIYRLLYHMSRLQSQRFLVITDHTERLKEIMRNARYMVRGQMPPQNVFFGTRFNSQRDDTDKVYHLLTTQSAKRFVIFQDLTSPDIVANEAFEQWFIPKCSKCGGNGTYSTDPFNPVPGMRGTNICRECPGWDYSKRTHKKTWEEERDGYYIVDKRSGGGIDWVILDGQIPSDVAEKVQNLCTNYDLPLFSCSNDLLSAIPDFMGNKKRIEQGDAA